MSKTNAVRILEKNKIPHETVEYKSNDDEIDALSVASKINADPSIVYKTLVAKDNEGSIKVFIIPGNSELSLKKAAEAAGAKKIELINPRDLMKYTGYIRGGCSPVGMKKEYPSYIDNSAKTQEIMYASAGKRGMQLRIKPEDLAGVINAQYADLIQ